MARTPAPRSPSQPWGGGTTTAVDPRRSPCAADRVTWSICQLLALRERPRPGVAPVPARGDPPVARARARDEYSDR